MKLVSTLLGQSVRFVRATYPLSAIYIPDVIKGLRERYGFIQVPASAQDIDLTKGMTFTHGKFALVKAKPSSRGKSPREIIIDRFQIYNNILLVDTKTDTDYADLFLEDVMGWAAETFDVNFTDLPLRKIYASQLEVECLNARLPEFQLGKRIEEFLRAYGQEPLPFETSSITIHCDLTQIQPPPFPSPFVFGRREGLPYSSNMFFSSAPLATSDHLALLNDVEVLISKKSRK